MTEESATPVPTMMARSTNVSEALRTILQEVTAAQPQEANTQVVPTSQVQVGQRLARDVVMEEPGYPPLACCNIDLGYAIRTTDVFEPVNLDGEEEEEEEEEQAGEEDQAKDSIRSSATSSKRSLRRSSTPDPDSLKKHLNVLQLRFPQFFVMQEGQKGWGHSSLVGEDGKPLPPPKKEPQTAPKKLKKWAPPPTGTDGNGATTTATTTTETAQAAKDEADDDDLIPQIPPTHAIVDRIYAGDVEKEDMVKKELISEPDYQSLPSALLVTKGATIPPGYDCVVPAEHCQVLELEQEEEKGEGEEEKDGEGEDETKKEETETTKEGQESSPPPPPSSPSLLLAIGKTAPLDVGHGVTPAGQELAPGVTVLNAGTLINPIALGLMQQAACSTVTVLQPVTVGILSLVLEAHEDWGPQQQEQANSSVQRTILVSLLNEWEACRGAMDLGVCNQDNAAEAMQQAAQKFKVVIVLTSSGNNQEGESESLQAMDQLLVQQLGGTFHLEKGPLSFEIMSSQNNNNNNNIKATSVFATIPKKPMIGEEEKEGEKEEDGEAAAAAEEEEEQAPKDSCLVFGLLGEDLVSSFVSTQLLVKPAVQQLYQSSQTEQQTAITTITAKLGQDMVSSSSSSDAQLTGYHPVALQQQEETETKASSSTALSYQAVSTVKDGRSPLQSLGEATGLAIVPPTSNDNGTLKKGDECTVVLLEPLPLPLQVPSKMT